MFLQQCSSKNKPPHKPRYRVVEFEDETSQFDPNGYWVYGCECYMAKYRCYVPNRLKDENLYAWLDRNEGDVVWIDNDGKPMRTANEKFDEQCDLIGEG